MCDGTTNSDSKPIGSNTRRARRPILTLKPKPPAVPEAAVLDLSEDRMAVNVVPPNAPPAPEPRVIRAMCFFDGQNLHRSAREAFGCGQHVDPVALAEAICTEQGWRCDGIRFYQGAPDPYRQPEESRLWKERSARLRSNGVRVFERPLQYIERQSQLPDGSYRTTLRAKEKGIDLRLGLDVFEMALDDEFDLAVLFCRDQDLSELVPSIRRLAKRQSRPMKLVSAYPTSFSHGYRGIDGTHWLPISKSVYETCLIACGAGASATVPEEALCGIGNAETGKQAATACQ